MTQPLRDVPAPTESEGKARDPARAPGNEVPAQDDPIAEHLRRAYEGVAKEPIPDRLQQLLEELRKKESE